jgi:ClpP class serine protease
MESLPPQRRKFKTTQDWNDFIAAAQQANQPLTGQDLFGFRKACYEEIEKHRGRPLLVYATKFLEGVPQGVPNFIDISDVDGFTDLINSIKGRTSVDVLLHSPGGRPDATERIVGLLRGNFEEVNFLIPHSAYSAATMLALSGNHIILHPSATLGPIDPQINGIPARSIKRGFEKAKERIAKEGPEALPAYIPLIEKYSLDLLELCDDSEKLSKELVSTWLKKYMFKGERNVGRKIQKAVSYFSDYDTHLMHSRPLPLDKPSVPI